MGEPLSIECEWWGGAGPGAGPSDVTRGAVGIRLGTEWLTRLEDSWGNTVRNRLNACAYTLAGWFAGNWWRLRWEPETRTSATDPDWRLSHSMASAGGGFCWPSILFASDGESIAVSSRATRGRVLGPVRYLNEVNGRIAARDFERSVDGFLSMVLSRLHSEGHAQNEVGELWNEVARERADPDQARWRRLEAICGFDPGDAPDALIRMLVEDEAGLGEDALCELAAEGRHSTRELVGQILELARPRATPTPGGFRAQLQKLDVAIPCDGTRPWQRATQLARLARREWGLGGGPISDAQLAELLGAQATVFTETPNHSAPLPLLLRDAGSGTAAVYLSRVHPTSRRFAASRLIGDNLLHPVDERLIPATSAKTSRQQFQRAFAQEFLCPFEALKERVRSLRPDDDEIAEAADYFNVSTRVVETTLVNKGELDRETLIWAV